MKDDILNRELVFGYYMNQEKLVFVDDTNTVSEMLQEIIGVQILDKTSVAHFFEFMEYLIRDDVIFLQECEENLTEMEENLTNHKIEDFNKAVLLCRKELLRIDSYFNQLVEIGETLAENRNGLLAEEDSHLFHLFADRAFRLYIVNELKKR